MKIYAQYETDGTISGLQHVENNNDLPNNLSGDYIEITEGQKHDYQDDINSHGVVGGVFSSAWSKPIDAETVASKV